MSRFSFTLAGVALGVAAGCSHPQKIAETAHPARPSARLATRAPAAQPIAAASEAPAAAPGARAIFFDFDSALLRDDARPVLQSVARLLGQRPGTVRVEGNCDEVGTIEYNLALGDQRARVAKEYLEHLGVPAREIATVSYGAQRPRVPGHDDAAHAQNRRDDLIVR